MIVELFAGPGGASVGMRSLGIDPIGIEWDAAACATRAAAGHRTIRADVAQVPTGPFVGKVQGLWASPPCPSFSTAGKGEGRDELPHLHAFTKHAMRHGWHDPLAWHAWSDPRTPLVLEPLRWVEQVRPEWVALEQVPPVIDLWQSYAHVWREAGYSVWCDVLNCADFGVPQTRRRAFLLASRTRIVCPPEPTHAERPEPSLFGPELLPWVSMADALGLPVSMAQIRGAGMAVRHGARPGRGPDEPSFTIEGGAWRRKALRVQATSNAAVRPVTAPAPAPAPTITSSMDNGGAVWMVDRRTNSRGPGGAVVPTALVPSSAPAPALAQAEKWVLTKPATTVAGDPRITARCHHEAGSQGRGAVSVSQAFSDGYDGTAPVKLTEREGSILQGFPPDYPWQGNRSKRWEQIGNAVPPPIAAALVAQVTA